MTDQPRPECRECGVTTGGGDFCYEHAPYMVYPQKDGSFISDRNGRKRIWVDDLARQPSPEPVESATPENDGKCPRCEWSFDGVKCYRGYCAMFDQPTMPSESAEPLKADPKVKLTPYSATVDHSGCWDCDCCHAASDVTADPRFGDLYLKSEVDALLAAEKAKTARYKHAFEQLRDYGIVCVED
jgi:hypothetical protein